MRRNRFVTNLCAIEIMIQSIERIVHSLLRTRCQDLTAIRKVLPLIFHVKGVLGICSLHLV